MTRALSRSALVLLALTVAACGSKGPVREPAELKKIESPELKPRVVWDKSPGDGSGDVASRLRIGVAPDLLVTADIDGGVYANDPKDGHRLWKAKTDARLIAGPTILDTLVLVGTLDGEVIALKRADGSLVWRVPVSSEVLAPPVGNGSIVVVRCGDGKMFGLRADDGKRLWSFDRAQPQLMLRGQSEPVIDGNTVYAGLDNGHAVALKLDTGEVLWEQVVSAPSGRTELERIVDVDADPLVTNGGVFAVSFGGDVAAVSAADGHVGWRRPVKSYTGIALIGDLLVVTDEDGLVWAFDAQSGSAVWKLEDLKYRKLSPPVAFGDDIVVADFEGYLHWLSPKDGHIVARKRVVSDPVKAPLVVQDNLLYVLDTDGDVAAVEVKAAQ